MISLPVSDFPYSHATDATSQKWDGHTHTHTHTHKHGFDVHSIVQCFEIDCINGELSKARRWMAMYETCIRGHISDNDEFVFRYVCMNGHLHVAQWLMSIHPTIRVSADADFAFRMACANGAFALVQWLLATFRGICVASEQHHAFRSACYNGHVEVVRLLVDACPSVTRDMDVMQDVLVEACRNNDVALVQALWSWFNHANTNDEEKTAMLECAFYQSVLAKSWNTVSWFRLGLSAGCADFTAASAFAFASASTSVVIQCKHAVDGCCICLGAEPETMETPCKHSFCYDCFAKCFLDEDTEDNEDNKHKNKDKGCCPYCRRLVSPLECKGVFHV